MPSSTVFTPYALPNALSYLPKLSDPLPTPEQLRQIENELISAKGNAQAVAKRAAADLHLVQGWINKAAELDRRRERDEKRKEKEARLEVKREASATVTPDKFSKDASSTPRSTAPPRKPAPKPANNKKRKRIESDDDDLPDAASPPPTYPKHKHPQHPPKHMHGSQLDFSLPATRPFSLPQPPPSAPQPRMPSNQDDVDLDLKDAKAPPQQITPDTFWKSVEPYLRELGEEDVGAMSFIDDDPEPFIIPPLGRHYLDVWAEEDAKAPASRGGAPGPSVYPHPEKQAITVPTQGFDPAEIVDADFIKEEKSLGPLTERVLTAFMDVDEKDGARAGEIALAELLAADGMGLVGAPGEIRVTAEELESRIKRELKNIGLLQPDEEPDFSGPADDSVLAELRHCQRLLKDHMAITAARKARLSRRCDDRLAYQDYAREIERFDEQIAAEYTRLTKPPEEKSKSKKRKNEIKKAGSELPDLGDEEPEVPLRKRVKVDMPQGLMQKVRIRQRLAEEVGTKIDAAEEADPGRFYRLPKKSIYEGITLEEGRKVLASVNPAHPALT